MNTYELERVIGDYVKRFDGVFSSDRLPTIRDYWSLMPIHPICLANTGIP